MYSTTMPHTRKKALIIKTGYSETLTPELSETASLGDVLRSTAILHKLKEYEVTWVTDKKAIPLLENNPFIEHVLPFNFITQEKLRKEYFHLVINLEKVPGICSLVTDISAIEARRGFTFNPFTGKAVPCLDSGEALYIANSKKRKLLNRKHWVSILYEMLGYEWKGESYIFAWRHNAHPEIDIGFNYRVGRKFENKSWDIDRWVELGKLLKEVGFSRDWQRGEDDLRKYINWLNNCDTIVTNDSLGLHIAMALEKKVVGLFGSTPASEIHPYDKGVFLQRDSMNEIEVNDVLKALDKLKPKGKNVITAE